MRPGGSCGSCLCSHSGLPSSSSDWTTARRSSNEDLDVTIVSARSSSRVCFTPTDTPTDPSKGRCGLPTTTSPLEQLEEREGQTIQIYLNFSHRTTKATITTAAAAIAAARTAGPRPPPGPPALAIPWRHSSIRCVDHPRRDMGTNSFKVSKPLRAPSSLLRSLGPAPGALFGSKKTQGALSVLL
jgi:hypothetical protein